MLKRTAAFTLVSLAALAGVASSSRAEGMAAPAQGVMVAFGDSQTWGVGATQDHHHRWTDQLEARLRADPALAGVSVINAGINGNRLLNDGKEPFLGPSGLSRFDADALSQPSVRWVFVLEGTNDIAAASMFKSRQQRVSAGQIIEGMRQMVARAHARGIRIWGGTILPCRGTEWPWGTPAGERKRQEVNRWIRESGAFDAMVDFDRLLRDPKRPDRLLPAYDSGDHLHPNDAAYRAMAAALDLSLFARADPAPPLAER